MELIGRRLVGRTLVKVHGDWQEDMVAARKLLLVC